MTVLRQTISVNYNDLDDHLFADYAGNVARGLDGNRDLPAPTPSAADGKLLIDSFVVAIGEAQTNGRAAVIRKNKLRKQVEDLLDAWSEYALDTKPNEPVIWAEANFRLTKAERARARPLNAPGKFQTQEGPRRGTVQVRQSPQRGTRAYIVEYALVGADGQPGHWFYFLSTTADCLVEDLQSGQTYLFRAAAWNGTSTPNFSEPERRIVQ